MSARLAPLALLLSAGLASAGPPTKYARPDLLVEASELVKPEVAGKFVLLDTRAPEKFNAGRIPRASGLW